MIESRKGINLHRPTAVSGDTEPAAGTAIGGLLPALSRASPRESTLEAAKANLISESPRRTPSTKTRRRRLLFLILIILRSEDETPPLRTRRARRGEGALRRVLRRLRRRL
jgi:hypothetical protein